MEGILLAVKCGVDVLSLRRGMCYGTRRAALARWGRSSSTVERGGGVEGETGTFGSVCAGIVVDGGSGWSVMEEGGRILLGDATVVLYGR
jgi:hypothetical protein